MFSLLNYFMFIISGAVIAIVDLVLMYLDTGKTWRRGSRYRSDLESVIQLSETSPTHSRVDHMTADLVVNKLNIGPDIVRSRVGDSRTAIVTGIGVGGIGFNTALQLLLCGVDVVGVCKTAPEAELSRRSLHGKLATLSPSAAAACGHLLDVRVCDLSDVLDVSKWIDSMIADKNFVRQLAAVVTNAGVMAIPPTISRQGLECQFATHHIGHSLLLLRLVDEISAVRRRDEISLRIVVVGSGAAAGAEDPRLTSLFRSFPDVKSLVDSGYNRYISYSNAKLCNIIFASAIHREVASRGLLSMITVNSLHPGPIRSRVVPNSQLPCQWLLDGELAALLRLSPVISATYVVDACLHKRFSGCSGRFLRMGIDMTERYRGQETRLRKSYLANTHWFSGVPAPRLSLDVELQEWLLRETKAFLRIYKLL